jgi:hypothetical protein
MLPWSMLPHARREPDFRAVRDIPAMLADAGLAIVRVGPPRQSALGGTPHPGTPCAPTQQGATIGPTQQGPTLGPAQPGTMPIPSPGPALPARSSS